MPVYKPILVVDDNEINQLVSAETVELLGYPYEVAANGQEALEKVKAGDFGLVLMDCQMPLMDGYEATLAIRKWEQGSGNRIPIVALTAHADEDEMRQALLAGMDDFLEKPINTKTLERVLMEQGANQLFEAIDDPTRRTIPSAAPELTPDVPRSERLMRLYLENVPLQLKELRRAFEAGDAKEVRAHAHKLKGSCLAIVAEPMAKTAQALQFLAEDGNLESAENYVGRLEESFSLVAALLMEELEA